MNVFIALKGTQFLNFIWMVCITWVKYSYRAVKQNKTNNILINKKKKNFTAIRQVLHLYMMYQEIQFNFSHYKAIET